MIHLAYATIEFTPEGCVTTLLEGGEPVPAHHHPDDPDYCEIAFRCGYGPIYAPDTLRYCREHDVLHSWLAEYFYDRPSDVLFRLAFGLAGKPEEAVREEILIQTIQRFVRGNERPIVGDMDWSRLKRDALEVLAGVPE